MILVTAIGWLIQYFAGIEDLLPFAFLAGLLIAPFVPTNTSCSIR